MEKIKLFCIPYSGGMAGVYYKWKKSLLPEIDICPIELSGHGQRIKEGFYENIEEVADDLSNLIISNIKGNEPYALFGHSLGALFAFEVYFALKKKGVHEPLHIFFSGRKSPDDMSEHTEYYKLPEDEFMEVVSLYGGSTGDIMNNRDLLNIFVPILRADFMIGETYEYVPHNEKIMCDFTVVNGNADFSVMECDITRWDQHAGKNSYYKTVNGSHFFIIENIKDTVSVINDSLKKYL